MSTLGMFWTADFLTTQPSSTDSWTVSCQIRDDFRLRTSYRSCNNVIQQCFKTHNSALRTRGPEEHSGSLEHTKTWQHEKSPLSHMYNRKKRWAQNTNIELKGCRPHLGTPQIMLKSTGMIFEMHGFHQEHH